MEHAVANVLLPQVLNGTEVNQLTRQWQPHVDYARALAALHRKRVYIFTEIGYCSGRCERTHTPSAADYALQAAHYAAVFEAMGPEHSWFDGAFWWNWVRHGCRSATLPMALFSLTLTQTPSRAHSLAYAMEPRPNVTGTGTGAGTGAAWCGRTLMTAPRMGTTISSRRNGSRPRQCCATTTEQSFLGRLCHGRMPCVWVVAVGRADSDPHALDRIRVSCAVSEDRDCSSGARQQSAQSTDTPDSGERATQVSARPRAGTGKRPHALRLSSCSSATRKLCFLHMHLRFFSALWYPLLHT
jgi:hypothetical protein